MKSTDLDLIGSGFVKSQKIAPLEEDVTSMFAQPSKTLLPQPK
jgi:hypothetical protein